MPPPLVRMARRSPADGPGAGQGLGGGEQLGEVIDPQDPGAAEGGVIDRIGAGQRAGVRGDGLGALGMAARP